ncbi:TetR family transcriptional regulator [Actinomadura sp. 21ATH]|uniref:TetR family transcriptional regulator n=1 Tax=Actinomadura sp. 21ATH TaxID=1735444 RepID=UPI0035BF6550
MDDKRSPDTRARILETALDLFSERGYQDSSMQEIALRLEITKATVFYHFPSKALLLATLCEPLAEELEEVVGKAAALDDLVATRRHLIEGMLDVYIRHRRVLRLLLQDLTLIAHEHAFAKMVKVVQRMHQVFAGPSEDVSVRVRAVQIFAMLSDPVMFFDELPAERLRAEILAGVWTLLDDPYTSGLVTREEAGLGGGDGRPGGRAPRRAGRPRVMDEAKAARARRMYAEGTHSVGAIAEHLGVSRATVYRHLQDGPRSP